MNTVCDGSQEGDDNKKAHQGNMENLSAKDGRHRKREGESESDTE